MKTLICELCGSNNFIKEEGYWVFNHCQTKYTQEEAKKIMVEGIVDVAIDKSNELLNFQKLAIQYYEAENFEQAKVYFSKILEIDTTDWKAKYEQNDNEWREKYKARFFEGDAGTNPAEVMRDQKEDITDDGKDISFDDLFKEREG